MATRPKSAPRFEEILRGGIKREDLWITSKLWNDKHGEDDVIASCRQSLADLRLDYLDLYLVHWPFPNFHPPGCDVTSRSPDAKPYIHENYMKTWRKMEELVDMGLVRHIGTSNMTIPKLKLVLRDARIKPAVNEMELHPHFQQPELFRFVLENGMQPIGYCPIGSPGRPERDRTPEDTAPTEDPVIVSIARRHGIHPAVVCIKWAVQRGQTPIPFSVHHYRANLEGVVGDPLTDEEMRAIAAIDRNCRLIKGQVFLWKEGQTWEDLVGPERRDHAAVNWVEHFEHRSRAIGSKPNESHNDRSVFAGKLDRRVAHGARAGARSRRSVYCA